MNKDLYSDAPKEFKKIISASKCDPEKVYYDLYLKDLTQGGTCEEIINSNFEFVDRIIQVTKEVFEYKSKEEDNLTAFERAAIKAFQRYSQVNIISDSTHLLMGICRESTKYENCEIKQSRSKDDLFQIISKIDSNISTKFRKKFAKKYKG